MTKKNITNQISEEEYQAMNEEMAKRADNLDFSKMIVVDSSMTREEIMKKLRGIITKNEIIKY